MAESKLNPNQRPDPHPGQVAPNKGSRLEHERQIARLDHSQPASKGGRC